MPTTSSYRIAFDGPTGPLRLCRIMYGSDGSYYVAMPVPTTDRAVFTKFTVNYSRTGEQYKLVEEAVDLAEATREDKEVKFSHHPDGFAQFSGANLVSGLDAAGKPRGMGVRTWPLHTPTRGPAFALAITRPAEILLPAKTSGNVVLFDARDVEPLPDWDLLVLEGHYFPPVWRRFIRYYDGKPTLSTVHPCGAAIPLRVVLPPIGADWLGFLGLEVYTQYSAADQAGWSDETESPPGFIFSGPTEAVRRDVNGDVLADGLYCHYPESRIPSYRTLDYDSNYRMNEVASE